MKELTAQEKDDLAWAVLDRYRRARDYRSAYILHQGCSINKILRRSRHQYDREYTPEDATSMEQAFGFCPTRYYGVCQQKVDATYNWKFDLVINSLDSMFTITPTPDPEIDPASRQRIREGVRRELVAKMQQSGLVDPNLLLDENGKMDKRVQSFMETQAQALKKVEQTRIVSAASQAAKRAHTKMRDLLVEGNFRDAYTNFTFDQILYGRGVMRYPFTQVVPVRYHTESGGIGRRWESKPFFKHVNLFNFYPVDDGDSIQTNSGNTERTSISKAKLIDLARGANSEYNAQVIYEVIDEYEYRSRNWLEPFDDDDENEDAWWGLDEPIDMLIHEGFFTGRELGEYGIKGIDKHDYVDARVEVVGGRAIRVKLLDPKKGEGRTYYQAPFAKTGDGLYDALGLGAKLWDTEQRINRLMHMFEHNIDWATRPAMLRNRSAFDSPNDAALIVPGGQYDVEERFGVTGNMPDAARLVQNVSSQYHLIMSQVNALLQQADNDSGIPAFAYGTGNDMGKSSLGEYTQRVSGSLRTVKSLALHEDISFIEPCFTQMFDDLLDDEPDLRVGADINVMVRGMTGLLSEDAKERRQNEVLPLILQSVQTGLVPPQAAQYAVRQLLDSAGFPVDELNMADPVTDNALAVAASMPAPNQSSPGGQQVPNIDARSGPIPQSNVATPGGLNQANLAQTGPAPTV